MTSLSQYKSLKGKISVYVPGTNGANEQMDNIEVVRATAQMLSELFGGATATATEGYWMSKEYGLIEEQTTLVYAHYDKIKKQKTLFHE